MKRWRPVVVFGALHILLLLQHSIRATTSALAHPPTSSLSAWVNTVISLHSAAGSRQKSGENLWNILLKITGHITQLIQCWTNNIKVQICLMVRISAAANFFFKSSFSSNFCEHVQDQDTATRRQAWLDSISNSTATTYRETCLDPARRQEEQERNTAAHKIAKADSEYYTAERQMATAHRQQVSASTSDVQ